MSYLRSTSQCNLKRYFNVSIIDADSEGMNLPLSLNHCWHVLNAPRASTSGHAPPFLCLDSVRQGSKRPNSDLRHDRLLGIEHPEFTLFRGYNPHQLWPSLQVRWLVPTKSGVRWALVEWARFIARETPS